MNPAPPRERDSLLHSGALWIGQAAKRHSADVGTGSEPVTTPRYDTPRS